MTGARERAGRCSSSATARCSIEPAGDLWGQEIPPVFDALRARYGSQSEVGVSARSGPPASSRRASPSVMNDRYHAFGRQGFGAIYGAKNLKAIVVRGSGEVPIAEPDALPRALPGGDRSSTRATSRWCMRLMVWMTKPKPLDGLSLPR